MTPTLEKALSTWIISSNPPRKLHPERDAGTRSRKCGPDNSRDLKFMTILAVIRAGKTVGFRTTTMPSCLASECEDVIRTSMLSQGFSSRLRHRRIVWRTSGLHYLSASRILRLGELEPPEITPLDSAFRDLIELEVAVNVPVPQGKPKR